jgi:hypothetical protein
MSTKPRDDKLRANIGMYEELMEDAEKLADIFIGNQILEEFEDSGEYRPFLRLLAEFHFSPENQRIYEELRAKMNYIKKCVLDLSTQIDENHKKALFIYRRR